MPQEFNTETIIAIGRILEDIHLYVTPGYLTKDLPTIPVMCKKLGISQSTVKPTFKTLVGETIRDYYLRRKMKVAEQMIRDGEVTSVQELATKMGYKHKSNFIRTYNAYNSKTAGQLLKELRRL
jgi:AraC-like DNA-binding protein